MGRTLTKERRTAAIAYWRKRLRGLAAVSPSSLRDELIALLEPDDRQTKPDPSSNAIRDLRAALRHRNEDGCALLDTWIARHLVDRGETLLISETRRAAVLAYVRDRERRERRPHTPSETIRIMLSVETGATLKALLRASGFKNPDEAIAFLLRHHGRKARAKGKRVKSDDMDDLLAGPIIRTNKG